MALRELMELGNLQDKTTHAVTPSKEGVGGLLKFSAFGEIVLFALRLVLNCLELSTKSNEFCRVGAEKTLFERESPGAV